jgi:hypothetical protein
MRNHHNEKSYHDHVPGSPIAGISPSTPAGHFGQATPAEDPWVNELFVEQSGSADAAPLPWPRRGFAA